MDISFSYLLSIKKSALTLYQFMLELFKIGSAIYTAVAIGLFARATIDCLVFRELEYGTLTMEAIFWPIVLLKKRPHNSPEKIHSTNWKEEGF